MITPHSIPVINKRLIFLSLTIPLDQGSKLGTKTVPSLGDIDESGSVCTGDKVSFVEFLIIEREFRLVQLITNEREWTRIYLASGLGGNSWRYAPSRRLVWFESPDVFLAPYEYERCKRYLRMIT